MITLLLILYLIVRTVNENRSDEELLLKYRKSRKPENLADLYRRYMPLVYGVALKYLKNSADAQDVVMSLFEELLEKTQQHDICVFNVWLYTCVRNYCLMELRKRSKNLSVNLDESFMEFCDDFNLDDIRETEEREKALQECIERLPEKQQQCVRWFFWEELSYKDIENNSGFSLKLVKSFIQNGKRNLKICLENKRTISV